MMKKTAVLAVLALLVAAPVAVVSDFTGRSRNTGRSWKDSDYDSSYRVPVPPLNNPAPNNNVGTDRFAPPSGPGINICQSQSNDCVACINSGCNMKGDTCVPSCDSMDPFCYSPRRYPGQSVNQLCLTQRTDMFDRKLCGTGRSCQQCTGLRKSLSNQPCTWYADTGMCGIGGCFTWSCGSNDASKCGAGTVRGGGNNGNVVSMFQDWLP